MNESSYEKNNSYKYQLGSGIEFNFDDSTHIFKIGGMAQSRFLNTSLKLFRVNIFKSSLKILSLERFFIPFKLSLIDFKVFIFAAANFAAPKEEDFQSVTSTS